MAPRPLAAALALPVLLVAAQAAQAAPIAQSQGRRPPSVARAVGAAQPSGTAQRSGTTQPSGTAQAVGAGQAPEPDRTRPTG
jgi:hypothetical protein